VHFAGVVHKLQTSVVLQVRHNQQDIPADTVPEHPVPVGIRMVHEPDMPGLEMVVVESMRWHSNLSQKEIAVKVFSW
jgi:hypothetical protein